jgi:hypothetical protein
MAQRVLVVLSSVAAPADGPALGIQHNRGHGYLSVGTHLGCAAQ